MKQPVQLLTMKYSHEETLTWREALALPPSPQALMEAEQVL